jgi:hypothetical protein
MITTEQIAEHYWINENAWQNYRRRTGDHSDAVDCPEWEIAQGAQHFEVLMAAWRGQNTTAPGVAWGISLPSGKPSCFQFIL